MMLWCGAIKVARCRFGTTHDWDAKSKSPAGSLPSRPSQDPSYFLWPYPLSWPRSSSRLWCVVTSS